MNLIQFFETLKDLRGKKNKIKENSLHVKEAVEWLCRAQDVSGCRGVARMYDLRSGWGSPYPETTGYIIPTLFDYFHAYPEKKELKKRALDMADWLLSIQHLDGGIQGGTIADNNLNPTIFNTGMVIFGWMAAFDVTNESKYLKAAQLASSWLVSVQDNDGAWRKAHSKFALEGVNTYNTRVAWSLLKVNKVTGDEVLIKAVEKNIDWALSQQLPNGWYENGCISNNDIPLVHTISYTMRGILEAGIYLEKDRYIQASKKTADKLVTLLRKDGSLAGRYDQEWNAAVKWSCLTGNAQTSIVFLKLYKLTKNTKYLYAAKKMNNYLKSVQDISSNNPGIRGGIKGSYPLFGEYGKYQYLNWAAKFFIDALLLEDEMDLV